MHTFLISEIPRIPKQAGTNEVVRGRNGDAVERAFGQRESRKGEGKVEMI